MVPELDYKIMNCKTTKALSVILHISKIAIKIKLRVSTSLYRRLEKATLKVNLIFLAMLQLKH